MELNEAGLGQFKRALRNLGTSRLTQKTLR